MATRVMTFYGTSVGKKVVMAVTGFIVFGFITVHMLGNLQVFLGPEKLNAYARFLKSSSAFLWAFRGVLLAAAVLHILSATQVTLQSWAARPEGYAVQRYRETTYAARTMRWGGPIIGVFVVYHLLHFTTGQLHPSAPWFNGTDVYNNVVYGFQVPWTAAVYLVAVLMVGLHLYHGVWSMLQTVGAAHPRYNRWRRFLAATFALLVGGGMALVPISVLAGWVHPV
ncbi:MAG: succinate dehydrogenase cytochrome b subunit [Deltaproteobacteria bacterium]|nr:succinate dehydrogenase cytochrome b subunit [Deltaproteobacteria bacterium]